MENTIRYWVLNIDFFSVVFFLNNYASFSNSHFDYIIYPFFYWCINFMCEVLSSFKMTLFYMLTILSYVMLTLILVYIGVGSCFYGFNVSLMYLANEKHIPFFLLFLFFYHYHGGGIKICKTIFKFVSHFTTGILFAKQIF